MSSSDRTVGSFSDVKKMLEMFLASVDEAEPDPDEVAALEAYHAGIRNISPIFPTRC